ncbi:MAG: NAD(P)/FAD-dependent oxidoreductase [Clostridiales bacterium]|nr:NAD(P)/FAD-dependent oxidoreductase [Clostridiales bacterium]
MYDVAIIGCGVIGAAAAFELSKYHLNLAILEKENDVAMGASRANSAIIHAGYDPKPGTLMARLNVEGNRMAEALCRDLSVPFSRIGSLVLAFTPDEMDTVWELYDRGMKNGVPGLEVIMPDKIREMEPQISDQVVGALWAPSAGIINPWDYTLAFAETAVRNGAEVMLNTQVIGIEKADDHYILHTNQGNVHARYIVNAAGVESGDVHEMVADKTFSILPNRGEYFLMDKCEIERANHVLFQCPNKNGKGVLVSPTTGGNLIVGPNAEGVSDAGCVNNTASGMAFIREKALKTVPTINFRNSIRNFSGVRANPDQDEFQIGIAAENFIDLAGIKSPGLSSAPAIALECVKLLKDCGLQLQPKANPITTRKKIRFRALTDEQKQQAIQENPLYGRVICRCETITEGEIVDAIHSPIPPCSVDGVKRRAGTGMGRCQGGFCGPRVVDILARELNVSPMDILQDGHGSRILLSETKKEADA